MFYDVVRIMSGVLVILFVRIVVVFGFVFSFFFVLLIVFGYEVMGEVGWWVGEFFCKML